jgi:hypothetical protein
MGKRGIERGLRELLADGRSWVMLATITAIEAHTAYGYLVDLTVRPSGKFAQARLLFTGTGEGVGLLFPVQIGDEVLVVFPDGQPNEAIAIAGLTSAARQLPSDFDNTTAQLTHANGLELRTVEGAAVEALLAKSLSDDLSSYVAAVDTFISACSTLAPGTVVQNAAALAVIVTAANAFTTATGGLDFATKTGGTDYHSKSVKSDKG